MGNGSICLGYHTNPLSFDCLVHNSLWSSVKSTLYSGTRYDFLLTMNGILLLEISY